MAGKVGRPSKKDEKIRASGQEAANLSGQPQNIVLSDGTEVTIQPLTSTSASRKQPGDFGGPEFSWAGAPTEGFPLVFSALLGAGIGSAGQYLIFPLVDDLVTWGFESTTGQILTSDEYDTAVSLSRQICWTTVAVGSFFFSWYARKRMRGSTVWPHIFTASIVAFVISVLTIIGKYVIGPYTEGDYDKYYKNALIRNTIS